MPCVLLEPEAQGSEMILLKLSHETKPQQVLGNVSRLFRDKLQQHIERDQLIN